MSPAHGASTCCIINRANPVGTLSNSGGLKSDSLSGVQTTQTEWRRQLGTTSTPLSPAGAAARGNHDATARGGSSRPSVCGGGDGARQTRGRVPTGPSRHVARPRSVPSAGGGLRRLWKRLWKERGPTATGPGGDSARGPAALVRPPRRHRRKVSRDGPGPGPAGQTGCGRSARVRARVSFGDSTNVDTPYTEGAGSVATPQAGAPPGSGSDSDSGAGKAHPAPPVPTPTRRRSRRLSCGAAGPRPGRRAPRPRHVGPAAGASALPWRQCPLTR